MARRATWRRAADDPTGAWGCLRRCARDLLGRRWVGLFLRWTVAWVPALLAYFAVRPVFGLGSAFLVGSWGLILGILATIRLIERPLGAFESLLPLPLPEGTFAVYVAVRQGGFLTGLDEATAAFVDGWLHVEGARTSFSLRHGDGRSERRGRSLRVTLPDGIGVEIRAMDDRARTCDPYTFGMAARRWVARAERPAGESVLPPCGVHPVWRRGWTLAALLGGLAPVVIFPFIKGLHPGVVLTGVAPFAFAMYGLASLTEAERLAPVGDAELPRKTEARGSDGVE